MVSRAVFKAQTMHFIAINLLFALNLLRFADCYQSYKYYQKGKSTRAVCGCAPDCIIRTKYDTKAFIFKDEYFWLFDVFENSDSSRITQMLIADVWPGLTSKLNYGFSVFNRLYFVKDNTYWVFNENHRKLKEGNITNWTRFPFRANAAHVLYENKSLAIIELYSGCKVFRCNMTSEDEVVCYIGEYYRKLNKQERILGSIHATTTLKSKIRIIFGFKYYCIILPGHECIPLCNPKTFGCKSSKYSDLVVLFIAISMILVCLLLVSLFWFPGGWTRGI